MNDRERNAMPAIRMRWSGLGAVFLVSVVLLGSLPGRTLAVDADRGYGLYDLHCTACHAESVHGRAKRVASDYYEVRDWVRRWERSLGLRWSAEDIDDVALWLNVTYYGYPCPPDVCQVALRAVTPGSRAAREPLPPGRCRALL
jgi:hypothetical protein